MISKFASNFQDLSGKRFGKLTVLRMIERPENASKSRGIYWLCRCECGKECVAPTVRVKKGIACGCGRKPDLVGEKHGLLTVIKKSTKLDKKGSQIWTCKCDCGNTVEVSTQRLRTPTGRNSYGCLVGGSRDLIEQKFGLLKVVQKLARRQNRYVVWKCLCDCGQHVELTTGKLLYNHIKSCGCKQNQTGDKNKNWKGFGKISGKRWSGIKRSAEKRGIGFRLSIKTAWNLFESQKQRCALSGVKLTFSGDSTASLDRIDSTKGYISKNVQWVHKDLNSMKGSLSNEQFVEYCQKVAQWKQKAAMVKW